MADNFLSAEERNEVLAQIPQQPPFRFVDEIVEMSENHIVAKYHFKKDEYFYKGHFPDNPITPGVILVEAMAQAGVVALGIYLISRGRGYKELVTFFTDCEVEFLKVVPPNSTVIIKGEKIFFRKNKIKTQIQLELENGDIAAIGMLSGIGVDK